MNKKGISAIVAEVLIILLTIVVAGIVSIVIVGNVQNWTHDTSECFPYKDYFTFDTSLGYTCYDTTQQLTSVAVQSLGGKEEIDEKVAGFDLVFHDQGSTIVKHVRDQDASGYTAPADGVWMAQSYTSNIQIAKGGNTFSYVYRGGKRYSPVEIYPVLTSGRVCPVTDRVNINVCEGGIALINP